MKSTSTLILLFTSGTFLLHRLLLICLARLDEESPSASGVNNRYEALCSSTHTTILGWEFAGPTTYVNQFGDEDVPKLASAAAVQNVVEAANHTWFISSVNGGVWRSSNIQGNHKVHWENVLDGQPVTCSSISTLHVSAANPTTIYAGCGGSTSSEQGSDWNVVNSGDWGGIMASTDLGSTWKMLEGFPENYYVTDILAIDNDALLVAAQSHLWDREDGGIWRSENGGVTFERVLRQVSTFTLTAISHNLILATHAHSPHSTISISEDYGKTFNDVFLPWVDGAVPFYTCATELAGGGTVVVGGLTRLPHGLPNHTDSQIFVHNHKTGWTELQQPMRMDQDSMPKDRMALLADPDFDDLLYVAGNAEALAWRVNVTTGNWTKMWDEPDVVDGSIPHGDCRNFAWDHENDRLLLVSDGGVFARIQPREAGGKWISLNGDYSGLELLSAHYDPKAERYVAGAQDNCAIVTKANATPSDVGYGFVMGDGTVTMVDSQANPSRLFGTTQFLGVGTIENDPKSNEDAAGNSVVDGGDDDDEGCGGLCFAQGDKFIQVEVDKYFPEPSSFPFFVHPYTLNRQDPTLLHFWTNGTGPNRPSAFYEFNIPYSVEDKDDIGAPTKMLETPPGAMIMDFVSGGVTAGKADPNLLLGISNSHLYVRSIVDQGPNGAMLERQLPVAFDAPVTLQYDYSKNGARILGPLTHAKTVFMAVSPSDSRFLAVTGWPSVSTNLGNEDIFVTTNAGETWQNVTSNLRTATGVTGKVRPGGLLLVDLPPKGGGMARALLVGTSNGIMVAFLYLSGAVVSEANAKWTRFGTCDEFPIVLTAGIDYEPISDRLVAATYGRGIYILKDAKEKLLSIIERLELEWREEVQI